ncbi:hypothetical protein BCON_0279g00180 [Botryotinia convoluta]|uniref:Uncharacterized protein n=1 Tax=Botryotinia convoluta TaxID=54673 RepID=A0A4Z1HE15_9HELO|nr:hypothetical protein BCON_0279g00180 [Botryotinia convoluta]
MLVISTPNSIISPSRADPPSTLLSQQDEEEETNPQTKKEKERKKHPKQTSNVKQQAITIQPKNRPQKPITST